MSEAGEYSLDRLLPVVEATYSDLIAQCMREMRATGQTSVRLPEVSFDMAIQRSRWGTKRWLVTEGTTHDGGTFGSRSLLARRPGPSDEPSIRLRLLIDLTHALE